LNCRHSQSAALLPPLGQPSHPPVTLVLGFSQTDLIHLPMGIISEHASVHVTSIMALAGNVLQELNPAQVISPLISGGSDAHEVALRLSNLGFRGHYKVLTTALPCADMVRAEISNAAPEIVVSFVDISTPREA